MQDNTTPKGTPTPGNTLPLLTDWFDHVFVINCAHRPDRLKEFQDEIDSKKIGDLSKIKVRSAIVGDYTSHPAGWGGGRGAWGCVLPGNRVQGRIHTASKAWYSGDAVEVVTRRGKRTTLTVNHPVLTKHGFVAAGQLRKGQYLVCHNARTQGPPTGDDVDNCPTMVGEVFDALVRAGHTPFRKRRSSLDFYGDGEFLKGDVEIVDINSPLLSTLGTLGHQRPIKHSLLWRHSHVQGGFPHSRAGKLALAHMCAAKRRISALVPPLLVGVRVAAQNDPVSQQHTSNPGSVWITPADALSGMVGEIGGQRVDGFAGLVAADDLRFGVGAQLSGVGQPDGGFGVAQRHAAGDKSDPDRRSIYAEVSGNGGDRDSTGIISNHPIHSFRLESGICLRAFGIGPAAELDASFRKPAFDDVQTEAKLARDLTGRFAGAVEFDDVVDVRFFHYEGEVFDFGTSVGYFAASSEEVNDESGIIVSNCLQSHRRIMEDLMHIRDERDTLAWESALILEDDVFFLENALTNLNEVMRNLPPDWGQLYLGGQHRQAPLKTEHPMILTGRSVNRTHAYAISRSYIQKIYCHVSYMMDYAGTNKHIDHQLELGHQRKDWPVYCPAKWICGQRAGMSNVSGRRLQAQTWL